MLELKLFPPTAKATSPSLGSEKGKLFSRRAHWHSGCGSETEHNSKFELPSYAHSRLHRVTSKAFTCTLHKTNSVRVRLNAIEQIADIMSGGSHERE